MRGIRDKLRAEHDLRLLQRLLRDARAPRAQRHLPVDGDDRRPHQRDHGRPHAVGGPAVKATDLLLGHDEWGMAWISAPPGGAGRGEAAAGGSRRRDVTSTPGRPSPPRSSPPRSDRSARGADRAPGRRAPSRTTAPAGCSCRSPSTDGQDRAGPGPARGHGLRLRVLERDRDRLHLRRPRHLPQVQGPARRARRRSRGTTAAPSPRATSPTAGGWPAWPRRRRDLAVDGAAADHPAQGGDRRRRAPGDPAAGRAEAVRRARRPVALRPAHRPGPADRRRSTTSS